MKQKYSTLSKLLFGVAATIIALVLFIGGGILWAEMWNNLDKTAWILKILSLVSWGTIIFVLFLYIIGGKKQIIDVLKSVIDLE